MRWIMLPSKIFTIGLAATVANILLGVYRFTKENQTHVQTHQYDYPLLGGPREVCDPKNFLVLIKAGAKAQYQQRRMIWRNSHCPSLYNNHEVNYRFMLAMPAHEQIDPNSHNQGARASDAEISDMVKLEDEHSEHKDMVFLSLKDVYNDFSFKTMRILEWAADRGMSSDTSVVVLHDDEYCLQPGVLQKVCMQAASSNQSLYAGEYLWSSPGYDIQKGFDGSFAPYFNGHLYALSADLVTDITNDHSNLFASKNLGFAEDLQVGQWVKNQADRRGNQTQIKYVAEGSLLLNIEEDIRVGESIQEAKDEIDVGLDQTKGTLVRCGNHNAPSCAECPNGNGASWCNGECVWSSDDRQCVLKNIVEIGKSRGMGLNSTELPKGVVKFVKHNSMGGRLGNQLFEHAAVLALAKSSGSEACVVGTNVELIDEYFIGGSNTFNRNCGDASVSFGENGYGIYTPFPEEVVESIAIGGYFQSWKYFADAKVSEEVQRVFSLKPQYIAQAREVLGKDDNIVNVGIHQRWFEPDYLNDPPVGFYQQAMQYFRETYKHNRVQFFIASANIARSVNIGAFSDDSVTILDSKSTILDFAILSNCDHIILSSGSFGWWAAWLGPHQRSDGQVVYYRDVFDLNHQVNHGQINLSDFYPSGWMSLPKPHNGDMNKDITSLSKSRIAYLITCNVTSPRTLRSTRILKSVGFDVRLEFAPNAEDKVVSNKLAQLSIYYQIAHSPEGTGGADGWGYIFDDDIILTGKSKENFDDKVDFSVSQSLLEIEPSQTQGFYYLGICGPKRPGSAPSHEINRYCGRCAHAYAVSRKGALALLEYEKHRQTEPYMDVLIDDWCQEMGGFHVVNIEKESNQNAGHHGTFIQDRREFPSLIG